MIRFIFTFLFIFTFCSPHYAQTVVNDTLLYNDSFSTEKIQQTRKLLIENFNANNLLSIKDILNDIDQHEQNSNSLMLNPPEKIMLLYRIGEYNHVFDYMEKMNEQKRIRHTVVSDDLTNLLIYYFGQNKDTYYFDIDNTDLPNEEKDFLKILLENILYDDAEHFVNERDLISNCNKFIQEYPESKYTPQVRIFGGEYELSPWSLFYGMSGGAILYTGDLHDFWENGAFFEITLGGSYKRLNAMISMSSSRHKAKDDRIINGSEWKKGNNAKWIESDFSLGYTIMQKRHNQKLMPFATIGYLHIKPIDSTIENNSALENIKYNVPLYGIGFLYDYSFIRLKYTYKKPCFESKYQLDGCSHSLSLGFIFSFQSFKKN